MPKAEKGKASVTNRDRQDGKIETSRKPAPHGGLTAHSITPHVPSILPLPKDPGQAPALAGYFYKCFKTQSAGKLDSFAFQTPNLYLKEECLGQRPEMKSSELNSQCTLNLM